MSIVKIGENRENRRPFACLKLDLFLLTAFIVIFLFSCKFLKGDFNPRINKKPLVLKSLRLANNLQTIANLIENIYIENEYVSEYAFYEHFSRFFSCFPAKFDANLTLKYHVLLLKIVTEISCKGNGSQGELLILIISHVLSSDHVIHVSLSMVNKYFILQGNILPTLVSIDLVESKIQQV